MIRFVATLLVGLSIPAGRPALGCTVFVVSDSTTVLAGNNEDFYNPATRIWFLPREDGKYGRVYFGFDDRVRQGGMNDQGLFFDTVSAPRLEMPQHKGKPLYRGDLITKAMEECATVEEVIALFRELGPFVDATATPSVGGAILFADSSGESVIIEGDVQIRKEGRFQVITNFYQSHPELGGFPCKRHAIAKDLLEKSRDVSVDLCRRILAATHMEHEAGFSNPTVYSNICDLKRGIIYVYHFHNFENVVVLDVKEELEKGPHEYDLPSLFPRTMAAFVYESARPKMISKILRHIIHEEGISAAVAKFHQLRSDRRIVPTHFCTALGLNRLGYELMGEGKLAEATEIFKLYVEAFPDDWNAYDSLGEAYMNSEKTDLAIQSYEKSLTLNPGNKNGVAMLRKLREKK